MRLSELVDGLGLVAKSQLADEPEVRITDLADDSRQVRLGGLFLIRRGGEAYLESALSQRPAAVIAPPEVAPRPGVTWLTCSAQAAEDQALAGELADRFFDHPSRKLSVVGITGTKGKTTTAILVQHLLTTAGCKCGLIGTIWLDDGQTRRSAELTTPGAIQFTRLLADMVKAGCRAAAVEVSSHALHQRRVAATRFAVGVFTNLTGDHLDYHGTMEAYADAKAMLFRLLGPGAWAVLNADDPYAAHMAHAMDKQVRTVWTSLEPVQGLQGRCHATVMKLAADHSLARYEGPWGSFELRLPLVGRHNVSNALQAITAANCVTAQARTLRQAMRDCPTVPGRLEPVRVSPDPPATGDAATPYPTVLVDYAHTHDSLEKTLLALKPVTTGRLIVLFGCGGDRDKTKRPKMAAVACQLADRVIITSDNPRTEDPLGIIRDILAGIPSGQQVSGLAGAIGGEASAAPQADEARIHVEPDRAKAIRLAIHLAEPGDTVLLAGKGHEDYQIIGKTKRHFDDREQAAEALKSYRLQAGTAS